MITIPHKIPEKLIKNVSYSKDKFECFFHNGSTEEVDNHVKQILLDNNIPALKLDSAICGRLTSSIDPHTDPNVNLNSVYSVVYFHNFFHRINGGVIHFYADKKWHRICEDSICVFKHSDEHAVINNRPYNFIAWQVKMKNGYKHR